jgi:hypothetical protein
MDKNILRYLEVEAELINNEKQYRAFERRVRKKIMPFEDFARIASRFYIERENLMIERESLLS